MKLYDANVKFIDWLAERITVAGRGDRHETLTVSPDGKFWLGRLQTRKKVEESNWGSIGERLEPCAQGLKFIPKTPPPWDIELCVSFVVWNKKGDEWFKSSKVRASGKIKVTEDFDRKQHLTNVIEIEAQKIINNDAISASVYSEISRNKSGDLTLSIELVNESNSESDKQSDVRLYECQLEVSGIESVPFELESLDDSFRYDRNVDVYGINCTAIKKSNSKFVTDDSIKVDLARPSYNQSSLNIPNMMFSELASDPVPLLNTLITSLSSWGEKNWSPSALASLAKESSWDTNMKKGAHRASEEFFNEVKRLKAGIEALQSNSNLMRAFKAMNQAMSLGKHSSWRAFQIGFILSCLPSIAEDNNDSDVVDVVWFATGGGKTETYLGVLVTAAFYDRLRGKITGITAWSRFPLRMLSLQQTQRFADAIASAEIVRHQEKIKGAPFSMGFLVGMAATPNKIKEDANSGEPDPDDPNMPDRYQVLEYCPFCKCNNIQMVFNRKLWKLEHKCLNQSCFSTGKALPVYVVDEEIYRFLPTIIVGTLDKAASISLQAAMRGLVGAPRAICSKEGHGYVYAKRSSRPNGCLVPGCKGTELPLHIPKELYGPTFRLQDELHLLRDSLGAVDSHYEALYDSLQLELCGRKPKILASSATLTGYQKQIDVLYRRKARVFPVPPPKDGAGFWTYDSNELMRSFVAVAPRGVTIEFTVDRLLSELQNAIRFLLADPTAAALDIGIDEKFIADIISNYGTNVVYGNTLRDLEAVSRSVETQLDTSDVVNDVSLTGKTDFNEVRKILSRLENPENDFNDRIHIVAASSMMSHGVDVERLNSLVMLGMPLSAAEFIQATARVGRKFPAIVFMVHKIGRERDAGIYRSFEQFVRQSQRFVEPVPIAKRSRNVLVRTLPGILLARILMIHEASHEKPLTTTAALIEYFKAGSFDLEREMEAIFDMLQLWGEVDEPMKKDIKIWLSELEDNLTNPPADARFPSDLLRNSAMLSLRDVEQQVPVIGRRV
ncbi:helicase-related protein [Vibrio parahaemolyticus]|uniref:helicase-related protein n=1 Tax=Vibrio parahaemolyticus TaxID=670 RepID=UPI002361A956|nr:helicase-related protein [Vibrio parahaemolyticus]MDG3412082.1 helicase-related protein [Vibrio parahaemolyticus]